MSSKHQFSVKAHILPVIKTGRKSLEIRVADEKRKKVQEGDSITFNHQSTRKITAIRRYPSFVAMLRVEDPEKIMPRWTPSQILVDLREIYNRKQEALGVLVFELQVDE